MTVNETFCHHGEHLPLSPILLSIAVFDSFPATSKIWRKYIPFGLADPHHGPFSHKIGRVELPKLKAYRDVPDGIFSYLSSTNTNIGDLSTLDAFIAVVLITLLFRVLKLRIIIPYFKQYGFELASHSHGEMWCSQNKLRIQKFSEFCFKAIYHVSISLFGIYYFWDSEWWCPSGTQHLWLNHPHHILQPGMIWYYIFQCAYNVEIMIYMIEFSIKVSFNPLPRFEWKETARGDFREMLIHHVITISLIYFSSYMRFTRIGSMVALTHDIADVPVDLAKLSNFIRWQKSTLFCFVVLICTWMITRLGVFPFVILRSVMIESQILMDGEMQPEYYYAYRLPFILLLKGLLLLSAVWFWMIIKMGWVYLSKGERHDLSEHKKGEFVPGVTSRKHQ